MATNNDLPGDVPSSHNPELHIADPAANIAVSSSTTLSPPSHPANASAPSAASIIDNKFDHGWRRIVRNFSPSWFSVTMGTGIASVLIISIPFPSQATWLYYASLPFFLLNILLFVLFALISILRYALYPEIWSVMLRDPKASLFLGTIPMGFATIIEMLVFALAGPAGWGIWIVYLAWALWMLDTLVAVAVTVGLCYWLISVSETSRLEHITAAQLLPIAATIVAAGTGSEVAAALPDPAHALGTLVASYVLWGMGMPLALTVLVIYYQRLAVHKLPPREVLVSCFLPLGPLGFGGYTIMYLGKVARDVFPATGTLAPRSEVAGDVVYVVGFLVALVLWGFGLVWFVFALAAIWTNRPVPFNMGWWGFTFPLGVYAASTIQIGIEMPSLVFRALGTVFAVAVVALWFVVAAGTARGAWKGELFAAPCLANLKAAHLDKGRVEGRGGKAA